MKRYDYKCPDGHKYEVIIRDEKDLTDFDKCPECGKRGKRVLNTTNFLFVGGAPTKKGFN